MRAPSSFPAPEDVAAGNDAMLEIALQEGDRVRMLVTVNPNYTGHALKEIARCAERGAIGIKLAASRRADDALLDPVCALAATMRLPVLFAFGGGVVGDLTGFVVAVFRRGIPYVQLPTTLLAQVDSAIGGKVGVDLSHGKTLVGAFYQPRFVCGNVSLLRSLPLRQRRSGLAEVIKYGGIAHLTPFLFF